MKRPSEAFLLHYNNVLDRLHAGETVRGWGTFKRRGRHLDAYYNKKLGVVIKRSVFILEERTPKKFRVPTYSLDQEYVIQPLVEKKNLGLAVSKIRAKLKPYLKRGIFPDLHVGNVGWYKNKPLMFDW